MTSSPSQVPSVHPRFILKLKDKASSWRQKESLPKIQTSRLFLHSSMPYPHPNIPTCDLDNNFYHLPNYHSSFIWFNLRTVKISFNLFFILVDLSDQVREIITDNTRQKWQSQLQQELHTLLILAFWAMPLSSLLIFFSIFSFAACAVLRYFCY